MFTKPNIVLAEQIFGWMTHEELTWLAKQAKKHQRIVEIGSYLGRSTRALGDNTDGVVFTIDDFSGPRDIGLPKALKEDNLGTFMWAMGDLLQSGKVMVVVSDHSNAEVSITPDMVFIDGSHEYEDVLRDITVWGSRLAPGGLICGHDYTTFPGVNLAVDKLIDKPKIARNTSIWYARI